MLNWLKRQIRDHFGFSKTETHGVLLLLWLIIGFLALPQALKWYYSSKPPANNERDLALLDSMVMHLEQQALAPKKSAKWLDEPATVSQQVPKKRAKATPVQKIEPFDINTADTSQLQQLRGIGPKLSARIIKYRDKLGGFISQSQYQEVYGLDSLVLDRLGGYTYIAAGFQPKQININTADFKTLVAHPYLNYQQVQRIVRYRDRHGKLTSIEDLVTLGLLEKTSFEKVKPYLKI